MHICCSGMIDSNWQSAEYHDNETGQFSCTSSVEFLINLTERNNFHR